MRRRARTWTAVAIGAVVLALLASAPLIAESSVINTCLMPCHGGVGIAPDIETVYASGADGAGHQLNWNPKVVADTSGAAFVQGSRMPCTQCHVSHGGTTSSIYNFTNARTGPGPITTVRQLCEGCHRPPESAAATPTVCGLPLKKLPPGPTAHAAGDTTPCSDCHGGSAHLPEGHGGGSGSGCGDAACHGSTGSHAIHVAASDPRGPGGLDCTACHEDGSIPAFASGIDGDGSGRIELDETDVCDTCHSPGGDYDGVDSAAGSIGARDYWASRVYETTSTLAAGNERWCVGCHDKDPSVISSVAAPNVAGDEEETGGYGPWGYYANGHGLAAGVFAASEAPAADVECDGCHDYETAHIDGDARTYAFASNNYQAGYRLRSVGGQPPLRVPRIDSGPYSGTASAADSRLCFDAGCHDSDLYVNPANMNTNFREDGGTPYNSHEMHLVSSGAWPNRWDSDWNGTGDSFGNCPACHNVHGSPSPVMVRHGELASTPGTTDKVPALAFEYTKSGLELFPTRAGSTGGILDLGGGGGSVANTGVCSMCHARRASYTRTPTDFYPPRIARAYGKVGSDQLALAFTKPVYTNAGASGALVAPDFALTDSDNGRTLSGASHTAGDDVARLTLSAAIDASDDLGTDTIAAATASSIYDAGSRPMGTEASVIESDATAPSIADLSPANGSTGAAQNAAITMTLADPGAGVDWSTFSITLTGDKGYSETYTDLDTSVVSADGTRLSYAVTVQPDVAFSLGEVITVTVAASDHLGTAASSPVWSFTVEATPSPQTMTLHPSGLDSQSVADYYYTWPSTGQWATYADTDDGDDTRIQGGTGAAGQQLWLDLDDPTGLGGSEVVDSVTVYMKARYIIAGGEPVSPTSADMRIGMRTGTATQWSSNITLDASGSYNQVASATFTTDSDGGHLTWSDINALTVAADRQVSGGIVLRITEAWAEVGYLTDDVIDPQASSLSPANGATEAAIDQDLTFTLSDSGAGVDWSTFSIGLSGTKGYSQTYTDADTGVVSKTGDAGSYDVTVNPGSDFSTSETITVTLAVDDLAGNSLTAPTWVFATGGGGTPNTVTLHPSGEGSGSHPDYSEVGGTMATIMDTNDGDSTYSVSNSGGPGQILVLDLDDASLGSATVQDVTYHIYGRYVSGFSPSPPAVAGVINPGFKTGSSVTWMGNQNLDGSGSYVHITSPTYTVDSDGGGLDSTDIDNMTIHINRISTGSWRLRVTEVYADVTYIPGGGAMKVPLSAGGLSLATDNVHETLPVESGPASAVSMLDAGGEPGSGFLLVGAADGPGAITKATAGAGAAPSSPMRRVPDTTLPTAISLATIAGLAWKALAKFLAALA